MFHSLKDTSVTESGSYSSSWIQTDLFLNQLFTPEIWYSLKSLQLGITWKGDDGENISPHYLHLSVKNVCVHSSLFSAWADFRIVLFTPRSSISAFTHYPCLLQSSGEISAVMAGAGLTSSRVPSNGAQELVIMTREVVYTKCLAFEWEVVVRAPLLGNSNVDTWTASSSRWN